MRKPCVLTDPLNRIWTYVQPFFCKLNLSHPPVSVILNDLYSKTVNKKAWNPRIYQVKSHLKISIFQDVSFFSKHWWHESTCQDSNFSPFLLRSRDLVYQTKFFCSYEEGYFSIFFLLSHKVFSNVCGTLRSLFFSFRHSKQTCRHYLGPSLISSFQCMTAPCGAFMHAVSNV